MEPDSLPIDLSRKLELDSQNSNHASSSHCDSSIEERKDYCTSTTEAVIESGFPTCHTSRYVDCIPKALPKKNSPHCLDLEQISLISNDAPSNSYRSPHFLDDDYHLKRNDSCKIPKPHFLDHSPSPDDDRFSDITNPHFLDESSDICGPVGNDSRVPYTHVSYVKNKADPKILSEQRLAQNSQHNDVLPGQASTSFEDHPGLLYCEEWNSNKDLWQNQDSCSVKSFSSTGSGNPGTSQQLGPKENCVYSLLSLLSLSVDSNADMSEYLLEMSHSVESCLAMRQSGCIPLLVQLIHSKLSRCSRNKAASALHNIIHAQPDDKAGRREVRVVKLLQHVWEYCHFLEDLLESLREDKNHLNDDMSKHPVQSVAALMKLSFDEEHRHVMCQLGGLQTLATLITVDQLAHGSLIENDQCITMRKYSGMALTNLTFGDGNNKALLCSFKDFMFALVEQLKSPNDDMRQVTAAVLRNLSWRADTASKKILREVGSVKGLTMAAMTGHKEATLKSILSALWNLTAHCSLNKVDICSVDGALAFLVDMLSFNAPSKTLAIIENAGGILRNISSHIAIREDYRQILRERSCLKVLLQQLKSPSLTIVSNACGTLWNLSARCQQDQQFLMDHGALPMLRSLIHSKHKMIAMGSSAALKNLLNSKPGKIHILSLDSTARDMNLPALPILGARKQKALEQELDHNLSETCENIEPITSPSTSNRDEKLLFSAAEKHLAMNMNKHRMSSSSPLLGHLVSQMSMSQSSHSGGGYLSCSNTLLLQSSLQKGHMSRAGLYGKGENVNRSESKDSVTSTHSDSVYERASRNDKILNDSKFPDKTNRVNSCIDNVPKMSEKDFMKRYSKNNSLLKYERLTDGSPRRDIVRNNYREVPFDESENCDQPIDYSKKYSEPKVTEISTGIAEYRNSMSSKIKEEPAIQNHQPKVNSQNVNFADYQETDLDQPTDYSLRYAEDQSDSPSDIHEEKSHSIHEDTMKHFCTEGTPYETPINFSTATSISDLRAIGGDNITSSKLTTSTQLSLNTKQNNETMSESEKDQCSPEDPVNNDKTSNLKQIIPQSCNTNYESKFSSGIGSPEKPVNYCEEGTPGYFSRVSSLSSLEESKLEKIDNECSAPMTPPPNDQTVKEKDCMKVVTFDNNIMTTGTAINYAEETPLMFSRCSSLESLSGCSVPDVGSVVSDFSRLTSGCISPSEIPDSPTHSPVPRAEPSTSGNKVGKASKNMPPTNRLRSVFEDEISTFKCEHTPVEFSATTSLSSLTIDDEPHTTKVEMRRVFDVVQRTDGVGSSNPDTSHQHTPAPQLSTSLSSDEDDDNLSTHHDVLASCINQGASARIKCRDSSTKEILRRNIMKESSVCDSRQDIQPAVDTCTTYCTEDTPAVLSKACSHSNLSVLSMGDDQGRDYSDDSSNISACGDTNHVLAQCIHIGIETNTKEKYIEPEDNKSTSMYRMKPIQHTLPPFTLAKDEMECYAVEDSPFQHSFSSSLSDLTIDSNAENKARLFKSLPPVVSTPEKSVNRQVTERKDSPNGSLSSVDLGSDDGHILDMVIQAGVPKTRGDRPNLHQGNKFQDSKQRSLMNDKAKSDSNLIAKKCDIQGIALKKSDSVSSLSSDSLDSSEGDKSILERCIQSGMPNTKWNDMHSKTLDRNFKARSSERIVPNVHKPFIRPHKSLERNKNDSKIRHTLRDPEFENLVAVGAYRNCVTKVQQVENEVLQESLVVKPKKQPHSSPQVMSINQHSHVLTHKSNKENDYYIDYHLPKNVQETSVTANIHLESVADVKTVVEFGNTIKSTETNGQITIIQPRVMEHCSITLESTTTDGLAQKLSLNGESSEITLSIHKMKDGSNVLEKTIDPKHISDINSSFNDSLFDKSNECPALNSSTCFNDSIVSGVSLNMSNESCADMNCVNSNIEFNSSDIHSNQIQSTHSNTKSHLVFYQNNSSLEKSKMYLSDVNNTEDTWGENTCPDDVSFPSISGSYPARSDFEEYICAGILPDLLEESILNNDGAKNPDITNQLNHPKVVKENVFYSENKCNNIINMNQLCQDVKDLSLKDVSTQPSSMSYSTIIENEATILSKRLSDVNYECPGLIESNHSSHSLDLDNVNPPSNMGSLLSLTQSLSGYWNDNSCAPEREKMPSKKSQPKCRRKKSLPVSLMVRRALGYCQSNQGSSEHLDVNALSNIDNIKPPSEMEDILDMENSMISVASIVSEVADINFIDSSGIAFDLKQPYNNTAPLINIDHVNPPSLFNELSESTLENEENVCTQTLVDCSEIPSGSDSGTPLPSDFGSSAESTPKRNKRYLTPKQKRQITKERYMTYVIKSDIVETKEENVEITYNNFTQDSKNESSPSVSTIIESKTNPRQRRLQNRERYQTQTIESQFLNGNTQEDTQLVETKLKMQEKKSMKQKRIESQDRFKTQTLDECSIPSLNTTSSSSAFLTDESNITNTKLHDDVLTVYSCDEFNGGDLDCETISLVSNEDDSELNSIRMRTFTRSFKNYLPVIESPTAVDKCVAENLKNISFSNNYEAREHSESLALVCDIGEEHHFESDGLVNKGKPKIIKPNSFQDESFGSNESLEINDNPPKGIRGRKKPSYVSPYKCNGIYKKNSSQISPKCSISNKVGKSVPFKSQSDSKNTIIVTKNHHSSSKNNLNLLNKNSTCVSKCKNIVNVTNKSSNPTLVRQGTFTKETTDLPPSSNSKLTRPGTIVKAVVSTPPSKLPLSPNSCTKPPLKKMGNNEPSKMLSNSKPVNGMRNSPSNNSLQSNDSGKVVTMSQKSKNSKITNANSSQNAGTKKQSKDVTSKIANLWKKVEQSKKMPVKPDSRVWISNSNQAAVAQKCSEQETQNKGKLIRSSTFEGPPKVSNVPPTTKQKSSIAIRIPQSPSKSNSKLSTPKLISERSTGIPSPLHRKSKV